MGKDYFEFLEEEFMGLTRNLQQSLAAASCNDGIGRSNSGDGGTSDNFDDDTSTASKTMELQFTRCQAIFRQMQSEVKGDAEFKERLGLYKIQLKALQEYYDKQVKREETTFNMWRANPHGTHLLREE